MEIKILESSKSLKMKNLNNFSNCELTFEPQNINEIFLAEYQTNRKIIEQYTHLLKFLEDKELLNMGICNSKYLPSKFIRCLDFFESGKTEFDIQNVHFRILH